MLKTFSDTPASLHNAVKLARCGSHRLQLNNVKRRIRINTIMAGIARANTDWASTHMNSDVHLEPVMTLYLPGNGATVLINGQAAITQFDSVLCGELAIGCSSTVFINGRGVHRLGDMLDSHVGTYSPSVCASASSNVFAGG
jgi:uncharacterized Zn-binding protein involved in type VI secretion